VTPLAGRRYIKKGKPEREDGREIAKKAETDCTRKRQSGVGGKHLRRPKNTGGARPTGMRKKREKPRAFQILRPESRPREAVGRTQQGLDFERRNGEFKKKRRTLARDDVNPFAGWGGKKKV